MILLLPLAIKCGQSISRDAMQWQPAGPPAVGTASDIRSGRLWLAGHLPFKKHIRRWLPADRQLCERHQRTRWSA